MALEELDAVLENIEGIVGAREKQIDYGALYKALEGFELALPKEIDDSDAVAAINERISTVQDLRDKLIKKWRTAKRNLDWWQNLCKDTQDLYKEYLGHWFITDEIKGLKSLALQEAAAHDKMSRVLALKKRVERQYRTEGHSTRGEAAAYYDAVDKQLSHLEGSNSNLSRQITVVQYMVHLGTISVGSGARVGVQGGQKDGETKLSLGGKFV